jgi:N-acetylneuraminic acid mutarotase
MISWNSETPIYKSHMLAALLAIGLAASAAVPALAQTSGTWKKTGNLKNDLTAPAATLLQNGQVLLAGGDNSNGLLASAELYNPANGQWTATGSMNTAGGGALTLLQNGQVLLTGADVELYNPSTGMWTVTANMSTARYAYTQTLLPNGEVLVAGGYEKSCVTGPWPAISSAELYNPATGTWTATGSINQARLGHTATLLTNGQLLVAGGDDVNGATAELYNPTTGNWANTGSMNTPRRWQYAVLLANGKPLVLFGSFVTSTELYDPATGKWTVNGNTGATAQFGFSVTLLNTGKVLIAGGANCVYPRPCQNVNFAELYDPSVGASASTGSMNVARSGHSATLLLNGQVLAAGGETQNNVGKFSMTNTAELYTP